MIENISYFITENKLLVSFITLSLLLYLAAYRQMRKGFSPCIRDVKQLSKPIGEQPNSAQALSFMFEATKSPSHKLHYVNLQLHALSYSRIGNDNIKSMDAKLFALFDYSYFSDLNLSLARLDYYKSLMLSVGIIGTFLGLVIGISSASEGLASTDATLARLALEELLSGCGLAFITSLVGLVTSTIYSFQYGKAEKRLSAALAELKCQLLIIFELQNELAPQFEVRGLLGELIEIITKNHQAHAELQQVNNGVQASQLELTQQFNQQLATQIKQNDGLMALTSKNKALMEALLSQNKQIAEQLAKTQQSVSNPTHHSKFVYQSSTAEVE